MALSKILLVDDDDNDRELTRTVLGIINNGLEIKEASSADSALALLEQMQFDCILCDYLMPQMTGLEMLNKIREKGDKTPLMFLSGYVESDIIDNSMEAGADEFFIKNGELRLYESIIKKIVLLSSSRVREGAKNVQ